MWKRDSPFSTSVGKPSAPRDGAQRAGARERQPTRQPRWYRGSIRPWAAGDCLRAVFLRRRGFKDVDVRRPQGDRGPGYRGPRRRREHGGARGPARERARQEGPAHGHHALDGLGGPGGAPGHGQARQHRARQRRGRAQGPQGRARPRAHGAQDGGRRL